MYSQAFSVVSCDLSTFEKLSIQCHVITESLITRDDLATVYYKHIIYGAELVLPTKDNMDEILKIQITANAILNFIMEQSPL